jgi:hypothetical protein
MADETDATQEISTVFAKICDLGLALGHTSIKDQPGCWEHQIDEHWWFAINPHDVSTECTGGTEVPPYTVYIKFYDWPFGLVSPLGGMFGHGALANENTLIAALDQAISAAQKADHER